MLVAAAENDFELPPSLPRGELACYVFASRRSQLTIWFHCSFARSTTCIICFFFAEKRASFQKVSFLTSSFSQSLSAECAYVPAGLAPVKLQFIIYPQRVRSAWRRGDIIWPGKGAKMRKKIGRSPLTVWVIVWPVRVASKVALLFSGGREMRKRTDWWTFHFQFY